MKIRPKIDMERREIAAIAGVTPALVSYYFPDKWDLFREAAQPVVDEYTAEVRNILRSDDTFACKLRRLIRLFITFNFEQGYILDYYMEYRPESGKQNDLTQITKLYMELIGFIRDLQAEGMIRDGNPDFIHSTLWVQCKYAAQQMRGTVPADTDGTRQKLDAQADMIHDLFLNGVAATSRHQSPDGQGRTALVPRS